MKTLKFLLAAFVILFFFSSNLFAQKEKISETFNWGTQEEAFCFWCPCAGDLDADGNPLGEYLCGVVTVHVVLNKNVEHWNIKGGKLIGSETGRSYTFVRTDNIKLNSDSFVINIRTLGENGLTTFYHGTLINDTFYCR
jgi:hypothetical protein